MLLLLQKSPGFVPRPYNHTDERPSVCYASELDRASRIGAVERNPEDPTLWAALTKHDRLGLKHLREAIKGEFVEYHQLLGWCGAAHGSHGIKWVEAGVRLPDTGSEIESDVIAAVLSETLERYGGSLLQFTIEEWEAAVKREREKKVVSNSAATGGGHKVEADGAGSVAAKVSSSLSQRGRPHSPAPATETLSIESYIKVGDRFFRPQPLPPKFSDTHREEGRQSTHALSGEDQGEEVRDKSSPRGLAHPSGQESAWGPMPAKSQSLRKLPKVKRRNLQTYFSSIDEDDISVADAGLGKWAANGKMFKRALLQSEESCSVASLSRMPSTYDDDGGEKRGKIFPNLLVGSLGWLEEKLVKTKLWKAVSSGVVGKVQILKCCGFII